VITNRTWGSILGDKLPPAIRGKLLVIDRYSKVNDRDTRESLGVRWRGLHLDGGDRGYGSSGGLSCCNGIEGRVDSLNGEEVLGYAAN